MTTLPSLPHYQELADALEGTNSPFLPEHVHGYVCGVLCATGGKGDNQWQKKILGENENTSAKNFLQKLYETTFHLLSEFSFEFALILPDDETDINLRSEALGSWCQGFLTALEQNHIPIKNRDESEVTEAINDLIEISQVNFGDIKSNEEDESAYFELIEYVRLAVLLIFHELRSLKG